MKRRNILSATVVAVLIIFLSLGSISAATTATSNTSLSKSTVAQQTTHTQTSTANTSFKPTLIWTKYLHKGGVVGIKPVWSTDIGFVEKYGGFGNQSSKNKVGIIIGVHPQEGNVHMAMWSALNSLSPSLKKCKIYVYKVSLGINQNAADYTKSRLLGQIIANKIVVPNVDTSFKLVVDVHGNRGYYSANNVLMKNFVFAPSNRTTSKNYAYKIIYKVNSVSKWLQVNKNGSLYNPGGTSPAYVTIPIANKGIPSVVFELYRNITQSALISKCAQLVKTLDSITYV